MARSAFITGWAHSPFGKLEEPDTEALMARVVRPALEFETLTVLPLSSKVPKLLPAFVKLMPRLPALEDSTVKLAKPATEREVPAAWTVVTVCDVLPRSPACSPTSRAAPRSMARPPG